MEKIELVSEIKLIELSSIEQLEINGGFAIEVITCCLGACAFAYQIGKDMAAKGW
ncbi:hypothetical protein J0383_10340 [Flavobacterium endoglycinae]|uniref:Class IIb bacteriocin, lactobin A/cerein 7B family n=1 Tax=Flavobacterium endoglycinae TaxID=2816357 RepID=A0ABX7QKM4_9FLAO|nr:hypothetical protein [Flavobacterium endoglycinae]QSW91183.1 hypothetical protein J0383_10340 [Flavobacterium endoglycinae]